MWELLESVEIDFLGLGEINRMDPSVTQENGKANANNCFQREL